LLFDWDPELPASIQRDVMISLDDPSMWIQAYEYWVVLFMYVMPMAMENLTIA
jgi:hypothetical protein